MNAAQVGSLNVATSFMWRRNSLNAVTAHSVKYLHQQTAKAQQA